MAAPSIAMGNIQRVVPIVFTDGVFVDEFGFFIRAAEDGIIKYCPINNKLDSEAITKTVVASDIFKDPELCRKVFETTTSPDTELYAGYGV